MQTGDDQFVKVNGYTFRGSNYGSFIFPSFSIGSILKEIGRKFFSLKVDLIMNGLLRPGKHKEVTKFRAPDKRRY